jgi:hypothetical protein
LTQTITICYGQDRLSGCTAFDVVELAVFRLAYIHYLAVTCFGSSSEVSDHIFFIAFWLAVVPLFQGTKHLFIAHHPYNKLPWFTFIRPLNVFDKVVQHG